MSDTLYFTGQVNSSLRFTGAGTSSQLIATGVVAPAGPQGIQGPIGTGGSGGNTWQSGIPNELPNGVRTLFTVPATYVAGSLQVFLNGLRETYISEASTTTFNFSTAPITSDIITLFYRTT